MRKGKILILAIVILLICCGKVGASFSIFSKTPCQSEGVEYWEPVNTSARVCDMAGYEWILNFTWYNSSSGNWEQYEHYHWFNNDSGACNYYWGINNNFTECGTNYTWALNLTSFYGQGGYAFSYNTSCWFWTENCSLFSIYPLNQSENICPCCDALCVDIYHIDGKAMNISIVVNDNSYINETNLTNGTYCYCLCEIPTRYNRTYNWYINTTEYDNADNYNVSGLYTFTTAENLSYCPCGNASIEALIEDTDTIKDDAWLVGLIVVFFGLALIFRKKWSK